MTKTTVIQQAFKSHDNMVRDLPDLIPKIEMVTARMIQALKEGGKILWMGNGGSAADAQHLAAEFVGRYVRERHGFASIALTTDTSILTAVSNDYGFDTIFSRQIEALCTAKDIVVGISTSGKSANVLKGINKAREVGALTIGFSGRDGGELDDLVDISLVIPADDTSRIQEGHILIGHIICDLVEAALAG
ncbi:D-sedoheptulose 7-phosphate isomerase [Candidatus Neomarinimicrobiota bacterium]